MFVFELVKTTPMLVYVPEREYVPVLIMARVLSSTPTKNRSSCSTHIDTVIASIPTTHSVLRQPVGANYLSRSIK